MICRQCGAEVPEGQPICPYCGAKMMRHLSDNDIEKLANTPSIPEEISGAHFAAPPTNDPVHPDDAGVAAHDVDQHIGKESNHNVDVAFDLLKKVSGFRHFMLGDGKLE